MRVNTLQTRCMVLAYIILRMAIVMKEPGMKAEGKDLECIHLEMVKPNLVTGKMESLTF